MATRHSPHARARPTPEQRARHPVAGLLGADPRRRRQVPRVHPARRQPRRGRHPRARRAASTAQGASRDRHGSRSRSCSACSARACSTATASSRRRSRCSARSRASSGEPALRAASSCRSRSRSSSACSSSSARHRPDRRACSARSCCSGSSHRRARRSAGSSRAPRCCGRQPAPRRRVPRRPRHRTASWCSARSSSCVTGGEALYADMGHFGRRRSARLVRVVLPALLLNYFGQGALMPRRASPARSEPVLRAGRRPPLLTRWSCSRPSPPSSRRRR